MVRKVMSKPLPRIYLNPAVAKGADEKKYIIGIDPTEIYTPERFEEIKQAFIDQREDHRKMRESLSSKEFKVPSNSDPNKFYTVIRHVDGQYECDCPGFGFRRKCSHIDKVKGE